MTLTLDEAIAERREADDILATAFYREKRVLVLRIRHGGNGGFSVEFSGENYQTRENFAVLLDLVADFKGPVR